MRRTLRPLRAILILTVSASAFAGPIYAVGDSLLAGDYASAGPGTVGTGPFAWRLAGLLNSSVDTGSWYIVGGRAADLYNGISTHLPNNPPDSLVIVEAGTSDFYGWSAGSVESSGTPTSVNQFDQDYRNLLGRVRAANPTTTLVCLGVWAPGGNPNALGVMPIRYDAAIAAECTARGGFYLRMVGLYANGANRGPAGTSIDNIHPNDSGHQAIAEAIFQLLSTPRTINPAVFPRKSYFYGDSITYGFYASSNPGQPGVGSYGWRFIGVIDGGTTNVDYNSAALPGDRVQDMMACTIGWSDGGTLIHPPTPSDDLVVIALGTNDYVGDTWSVCSNTSGQDNWVPFTDPTVFRANYASLLDDVRAATPNGTLVCLGIWEPYWGSNADSPHLLNPIAVNSNDPALYDLSIAEECMTHAGIYVGMAGLYANASNRGPKSTTNCFSWIPNPPYNPCPDNFHPNDTGHQAMAVAIDQALQSSGLPLGLTCTSDPACLSGHCVDGVCCDSACMGQCEACNVTGSTGACTAVSGQPVAPRPSCSGSSLCCAPVPDGGATDGGAIDGGPADGGNGGSRRPRGCGCATASPSLGLGLLLLAGIFRARRKGTYGRLT